MLTRVFMIDNDIGHTIGCIGCTICWHSVSIVECSVFECGIQNAKQLIICSDEGFLKMKLRADCQKIIVLIIITIIECQLGSWRSCVISCRVMWSLLCVVDAFQWLEWLGWNVGLWCSVLILYSHGEKYWCTIHSYEGCMLLF